MNRFIFSVAAGRNLPKTTGIAASFNQRTVCPPAFLDTRKRYSTKMRVLTKVVPEFWIMKMKTAFAWNDVNGDGYIKEEDFASWIRNMSELFPDMNEEQKKILEDKHEQVWGYLLDGKGKGPDYKVTESMYIEAIFNKISKEGAEAFMKKEWQKNFAVMDVNQDGVISKTEHRRFFEARKHIDPNGAIVAFSAIDTDMDGAIGRDEYVEAAMEFFCNFSDETKPSKHFFGPLVKI